MKMLVPAILIFLPFLGLKAQTIDAENSLVSFEVSNLGVKTVKGTFTGMEGKINFDLKDKEVTLKDDWCKKCCLTTTEAFELFHATLDTLDVASMGVFGGVKRLQKNLILSLCNLGREKGWTDEQIIMANSQHGQHILQEIINENRTKKVVVTEVGNISMEHLQVLPANVSNSS